MLHQTIKYYITVFAAKLLKLKLCMLERTAQVAKKTIFRRLEFRQVQLNKFIAEMY